MKKPNIVFFFSDQQRWDTLGCYGQKLDVTPRLDALAEKGVRFENTFTCQPVCGPARASLQTGKYATEVGCYRNGITLPSNEKTLAKYFSEAGYETAYVGKWHLAFPEKDKSDYPKYAVPRDMQGGYDYWRASNALEHTAHGYDGYIFDEDMKRIDFKGYRTDCVTDFAIDFIKNRKSEKPFFLFISNLEPHHQNDRNCYEGPAGSKEKFGNYEVPKDLLGQGGDWKENFADYLGACRSLDDNAGKVLDALKEKGVEEETVFFYTSDHGSHFRTRNKELVKNGYDDYKRSCHESSIHIPLIVYGKEFTGGKVIKEAVSLIDLPPTMLACAGIEKPSDMKGRVLQKLLSEKAVDWDNEIFLQISESQVGRAIRTDKWKYSVYAPDKDPIKDSKSDVYIEQYLYDLERDPDELDNLVERPEFTQIRSGLSEILKRKMKEAGEKVPVILPYGKKLNAVGSGI